MATPGPTIFDQSPNGLALLDIDGCIAASNPAFERLVEIDATELEGRPLAALFPGRQADEVARLVADVACRADPVRAEALLSTRTGTTRLVTFALSRLPDDGTGIAMLVTADDVTADRRATIRVAHDQKLEELGRLASGISHEIRSPLQYVITSLDYLRTTVDSLMAGSEHIDDVGPDLAEALDEVAEGVARINEISQGMNVLAHRPPGERTDVDVREILGFPLAVARGLAPAGTELVRHDPADDLPPVALVVGRAQQAILNVLVNAVHAIEDRRVDQPRHTGRIDLFCDHDDTRVTITVVDDGIGMDAVTKAQATDAFFTTKAEGRGTGQGLSLVREVLDEHGGALTITSAPGEGTTVSLQFPRSAQVEP
ncbi:MAG: two-component system sensor histidine kinase NtrB [Acidimicrobiales bacterium]